MNRLVLSFCFALFSLVVASWVSDRSKFSARLEAAENKIEKHQQAFDARDKLIHSLWTRQAQDDSYREELHKDIRKDMEAIRRELRILRIKLSLVRGTSEPR